MLGTQDLLVGLVLAAFFFGAKRLPELARSLGQSMTEFKKAVSGEADKRPAGDPPALPAAPAAGGRACPTCNTALEPEWTHCPRCGTAAAAPPPTSGAV